MKLNPEMVILAREFQGMTQAQLAEASGLTQPRIARVEAGIGADLSEDEFLRLSNALEFPTSFFFINEERHGYGTSSVFTRSRQLTGAEKKKLSGLINVLRIQAKRMLSHVDIQAARKLPRMSLDDYPSPSAVASALRAAWNLPLGPIRNITKLVEGAGVIVIECDFNGVPMDATTIVVDDLPPMIFVNRDVPGDRYRFTIAHELAHLVMHDIPTPTMEDEADSFASEFLAPAEEIAPELQRTRVDKLESYIPLKGYWGISIAALIRKAKDLGKISSDQYARLFIQMTKLGIRKNEPSPIPRETTNLHPMMVNYFRTELGFTEEEFAKVVLFNPSRLKELYGASTPSERPRLRMVR